MSTDELRDYFTDRLTWLGVQYPDRAVTELLSRVERYVEPKPGVWVAFNWDGSAFVPFATELEALRHASSYHMPVKFVEFGDEEWMRR